MISDCVAVTLPLWDRVKLLFGAPLCVEIKTDVEHNVVTNNVTVAVKGTKEFKRIAQRKTPVQCAPHQW